MVSAYEQARLENIERNNEVLKSLGLLGDPDHAACIKRSSAKRHSQPIALPPRALSSRLAKKPVSFTGLTEKDLCADERTGGSFRQKRKVSGKKRPNARSQSRVGQTTPSRVRSHDNDLPQELERPRQDLHQYVFADVPDLFPGHHV